MSKIMIVDDEPVNVLLVKKVLVREAYKNLFEFTSPVAALDAFEEIAPDLVIVDLHMPVMDGYELIERIQDRLADDEYLPVLVLTADVTPDARNRSFHCGAQDFMTKPID